MTEEQSGFSPGRLASFLETSATRARVRRPPTSRCSPRSSPPSPRAPLRARQGARLATAAAPGFGHTGVALPTASAPSPSRTFDETAARAELERLSTSARGADRIAEVVFARVGSGSRASSDGHRR
jgi:hypothetical protein